MNAMSAARDVGQGELNDYEDESEYEDYEDDDGIGADQQLHNDLLRAIFGDIYENPSVVAACDEDILIELLQSRLFDPSKPQYEHNKPAIRTRQALSSPQLAFQEFLADGYQHRREHLLVKEHHAQSLSVASSLSPSRLSSAALSPRKVNHMLRRFQTLEEHRARKIRVKRNEAESREVYSIAHYLSNVEVG